MPLSTKLSICGAAALLVAAHLPKFTSAQSTCRWSYSSRCNPGPKSSTYNVIFEVDAVSSNQNIDSYPVTAIFHWGDEENTFTDSYKPGKQNTISDTYFFDSNGFYTTGFSLIFGDGAAGCSGKTIQKLDTLEMASSCDFGGESPPPTPPPTTLETPEPTPVPSQDPITLFPTVKPTTEPTPQPTSPPTIVEPVTTTTAATTTAAATTEVVTTTSSPEASTTKATTTSTTTTTTTTTSNAPDTATTTSATPGTTSSTTTTEISSQRQLVPSSMTLYNVGELDGTALAKWETKTIQQIITHSEDDDITVTLDNVSQVPSDRRFLRQQEEQQQHSRILADDGSLVISFVAVIEPESNYDLTAQDAFDIVVSGFSTSARQTEYIYSLKSADSTTFGNIDRMVMYVDGMRVVTPGIDGNQKPNDGDGDGSGNMGIIIGAVVAGVLVVFILIGSIFYTKRRRQLEPSKSGSPLKDKKVMMGDDILGKEWSTRNEPESPDEQTCSSPYLGTIESREGEDDVSTLGDPYFGEAIDARDTGTVAESMVSSDMLALGVKRRGVGSSNASRMDATTATGYTGVGSTYPMTFADDTTLDDAYQTPDAIGYEEEEDEDYERIVVVAPPGKLGIVIDNPSGNIPFVHAIKETSVLHGKVYVGDLVLAVDEVDCRGMHSMSVSRLISKRSDSARTLKLLRKDSSC
ncbi:hypothetical protein ACHAWT_009079 [Skeletonema menzelii]